MDWARIVVHITMGESDMKPYAAFSNERDARFFVKAMVEDGWRPERFVFVTGPKYIDGPDKQIVKFGRGHAPNILDILDRKVER